MAKKSRVRPIKLIRPPGTRPPEVPPDTYVRDRLPLPVRMIVDGDNHYPVRDRLVEAAKFAFARDFRPDTWINLGDQYDFWSISRHDKEPERWLDKGGRLQEEFDSSADYWREVTRIARRVEFIPGNHEARLMALVKANQGLWGLRAFDWHNLAGIPAAVKTHPYGTVLEVGGISIEHGDRLGGKLGVLHAAHWVLNARVTHTIFGHTHRVETKYRTFRKDGRTRTIFASNQGHGSDVSKQTYAGPCPNWQHGFSAVEFYTVGGAPRFTVHPIMIMDGRFMFGGRLYDGRRE